jgi:hypothetical protein
VAEGERYHAKGGSDGMWIVRLSQAAVTSGVDLPQNHRVKFREAASAYSPDPIEDAAVLGPIKAKPFGWPRKARPALTGPARDGREI